ncbi:MAG: glycosyltransferase family 4 protein [Gammaproteobacteria bacterium]|nr:glycosyltransferase family 4 protein [Gammaproteobacteria bacterium]
MRERVISVMARMLDQEDGLYVYARNLLEQLLTIDGASRYLILLRTAKQAHLFDRFHNADVRVLPARSKTLWDQLVAPLAASREDADLIFNPKFSVPLLTRRPTTFVLQGSDWYVNPRNYPWWDNLYIRLTMPLYCRKAERLLAISRTVVDDLDPYLQLDRDRIEISYAAPSPNFTPARDEAALARFREEHRLPERFVLTVARGYHTGHRRMPEYPGGNNERLIRGYRKYRADGGTLPLVVAGRAIEPYLRARGLGDRDLEDVHFIGFVAHERMHLAYQLAEYFVLATLNESFGFPMVEAMACGCPAIVPSTGACPEIGASAVRLINPFDSDDIADKLLELERSEDVRERLARAGVDRARQFSWAETARRTLSVFDALVPVEPQGARVPR